MPPGMIHGHATSAKRQHASSCDSSGSPSSKRSRRSTVGKVINYDMNHHPMDEVLRPGVVAMRQTRKREILDKPKSVLKKPAQEIPSETSISPQVATEEPKKSDIGASSPLRVDLEMIQLKRIGKTEKHAEFNTLTLPLPLEFRRMEGLDQLIYTLQQGTRINRHALPFSWPEVVAKLRTADLITIRQLQAWGGTKALKCRYAAICTQMDESFGVKDHDLGEPAYRILMRAEGRHILDQDPGTKYWAHYKDSIVHDESKSLCESVPTSWAQVSLVDEYSDHTTRKSETPSCSNASNSSKVAPCTARSEDASEAADNDGNVEEIHTTGTTDTSPPPYEEQFEYQLDAIIMASVQDHNKLNCVAERRPNALQGHARPDSSTERRKSSSSPNDFSKHCASDHVTQKRLKHGEAIFEILEDTPAHTCKATKPIGRKSDSPANDSAKENHLDGGSSAGMGMIEMVERRVRSRVVHYHPIPRHGSLPTGPNLFVPTNIDHRDSRFMAMNLRTGKEGSISDAMGDIIS